MSDFSMTLKALRKEHHLSQQDLAVRLGISKSAVSMYEQGQREPDFEMLGKIADLFQADTDYLLGRSAAHPKSSAPVTVAAHLDMSDLTKKELKDVEDYIAFVRSRRTK